MRDLSVQTYFRECVRVELLSALSFERCHMELGSWQGSGGIPPNWPRFCKVGLGFEAGTSPPTLQLERIFMITLATINFLSSKRRQLTITLLQINFISMVKMVITHRWLLITLYAVTTRLVCFQLHLKVAAADSVPMLRRSKSQQFDRTLKESVSLAKLFIWFQNKIWSNKIKLALFNALGSGSISA